MVILPFFKKKNQCSTKNKKSNQFFIILTVNKHNKVYKLVLRNFFQHTLIVDKLS